MKTGQICAIAVSLWILTSCAVSTNIEVLHPAYVDIPGDVQRFAIVNRTLPTKGDNAVGNVIEGVLTGEGIMADRYGARRAVGALQDVLLQSPRFEQLIEDPIEMKGKGIGQVNPALSWNRVDSICEARGVDAIIVLEAFDTDQFGSVGGEPVLTGGYGRARVETAWRIYYPKDERIIDEIELVSVWDASRWVNVAFDPIPPGNRSSAQAGMQAGWDYGHRIAPMFVWERREIYKAADDRVKIGVRKAQSGRWQQAAVDWEKVFHSSTKRRHKKKAAYNLAVAHEAMGNLEQAKTWAQRAYEIYNYKRALKYLRILEIRIQEREMLKKQMPDYFE